MNEKDDILICTAGEVTIPTDEYRRLVAADAYLTLMLELFDNGSNYINSDVAKAVAKIKKTMDCPSMLMPQDGEVLPDA